MTEKMIEQFQPIIMGKVKDIPEAEKKKMLEAYNKLYLGLVLSNWAQKRGKLGQALFDALKQAETWVNTKKSSNPAFLYLKQVFESEKVRQQQNMMKNENKEMVLQTSPEELAKMKQEAAQEITKCLQTLNSILAKYKEAEKPETAKSFNIAKEQLAAMYKMRLMQTQRQNEYH